MEKWLVALSNKEGPVAYTFEKHVDAHGRRYMIVKVSFDLPTDGRVCYDLSDGCLSLDVNADRFAWANLDSDGEVIDKGEIRFNLDGASKGQINDRLGRVTAELVGLAQKAKKPIVMEDLNAAAMRRGMKYESPNRNRVISTFACRKMTEAIEARAAKTGYAVIKVNPAYTSFESKVLLIRKMGTSVHVGAAVMIGRRALCILSSPPRWANPIIGETRLITKQGIRHEWKAVYAYMKKLKVKTHTYYKQIPVFKKKTQLRKWLETA
jgi:IS605 OrfB family transposase